MKAGHSHYLLDSQGLLGFSILLSTLVPRLISVHENLDLKHGAPVKLETLDVHGLSPGAAP